MSRVALLADVGDDGKLRVHAAALVFLRTLHAPIYAVASVGTARVGKSSFGNALAAALLGTPDTQPALQRFGVGDTVQSHTRGVHVLLEPLPCPSGAAGTVLLLDCEGLERGSPQDVQRLSAVAALASSTVLLHVTGVIDQNAVRQLAPMTWLIRRVARAAARADSAASSGANGIGDGGDDGGDDDLDPDRVAVGGQRHLARLGVVVRDCTLQGDVRSAFETQMFTRPPRDLRHEARVVHAAFEHDDDARKTRVAFAKLPPPPAGACDWAALSTDAQFRGAVRTAFVRDLWPMMQHAPCRTTNTAARASSGAELAAKIEHAVRLINDDNLPISSLIEAVDAAVLEQAAAEALAAALVRVSADVGVNGLSGDVLRDAGAATEALGVLDAAKLRKVHEALGRRAGALVQGVRAAIQEHGADRDAGVVARVCKQTEDTVAGIVQMLTHVVERLLADCDTQASQQVEERALADVQALKTQTAATLAQIDELQGRIAKLKKERKRLRDEARAAAPPPMIVPVSDGCALL